MSKKREASGNTRVIEGAGRPCPRCREVMEAREHIEIRDQELRQPFYYRRWYYCQNTRCLTSTVMLEEDRIATKRSESEPSLDTYEPDRVLWGEPADDDVPWKE